MSINKNHTYRIRLSDAELEMFKNKAKAYPNVSCMVRKAVQEFDDRTTREKKMALDGMLELYKKYKQELGWLGGNLNQSMKRANELAIGNALERQFFEKTLFPQVREIMIMLQNIRTEQTKIAKAILGI